MRATTRRAENAVPTARADSDPPLLRVQELAVRYPGRSGGDDVVAVGGVSLQIAPGESVGLVGESGSGKTTLARCLVGLAQPTSGGFFLGQEWIGGYRDVSGRRRRSLHREIQMVFQDPYSSLNPSWTVGGVLRQALRYGAGAERPAREQIGALLERVGLSGQYADRKPVALSGGERQRVALARAIAVGPKLIVCDEPVSALDVSVQAQILSLLTEIRNETGAALLFITHDLAVVRQVTERVFVMKRGRIVDSGETGHVLDNPQDPYTRELIDAVPRGDGDWLTSRPAAGGQGEPESVAEGGTLPVSQ